MKLRNANAHLFIPDGQPPDTALDRITHLGIGAHPDDLEFMAYHGIVTCYNSADEWFGGVTCTDGAGSARTGRFANFTDEQMRAERRREQDNAAIVGRYGAMFQLGYDSSELKNAQTTSLTGDLRQILAATRPRVVYTHNPADKHETHVAVVVAALQAMRAMPAEDRPRRVFGCEVWRGLDWLPDEDKVIHDVSANENLARELGTVFESQIAGGKRYDLATLGRRRANATFLDPHQPDEATMVSLAMDLTPLVADPSLDIAEYVANFIVKFEADVRGKLSRQPGR